MRLDLIEREIFDVINFLTHLYPSVPIVIMAGSYGCYRTITTMSHFNLQNVEHIVFINPAFKMISILEKLKEFNYSKLDENSIVPMKQSLNKYLSKKFLDDLYKNDIYKLQFSPIPITIFIGTRDSLIPLEDILDFVKIHNTEVKYIDDEHSIENPENWQTIIKFLKEI